MPKQVKQTFRQFCESELSMKEFNSLYKIEGVKKYSITSAINTPQKMAFDLLISIAKKISKNPLELAQKYECSLDVMTARQYLSL